MMTPEQHSILRELVSVYRKFVSAENDFEKLRLLGSIEDSEYKARRAGLSRKEISNQVNSALRDGDDQLSLFKTRESLS